MPLTISHRYTKLSALVFKRSRKVVVVMKNAIIDAIEKKQLRTDIPSFKVGDEVRVHVRITEGKKERIQIFAGSVIAKDGGGITATFVVRKMLAGLGIEKKFLLHSPRIAKLEVMRAGSVRRAKLYYLRDRIGSRALRIKEEEQLEQEIVATQEEVKQHIVEDQKAIEEAKQKRHEERMKKKAEAAAKASDAPAAPAQ